MQKENFILAGQTDHSNFKKQLTLALTTDY